jgi:hypothetical protein
MLFFAFTFWGVDPKAKAAISAAMNPYIMSRYPDIKGYVAYRVSEAAADKISFFTPYNLLATGFKWFHSITKETKLLEIAKTF